jgi:hypothetical protein
VRARAPKPNVFFAVESAMSLDSKPLSRIVIALVMILCGAGVPALSYRWIYSVFSGPAAIELDAIAAIDDPAKLARRWVTFKSGEAVDTGLCVIEEKNGVERLESRYYLVKTGDRWLIAEVLPEFKPGQEVSGYLQRWYTPFETESIAQIKAQFPEYAAALLDFQLDAETSQRSECFAMLAVCAFFFAIGIFILVRKPTAPQPFAAPTGPRWFGGYEKSAAV